MQTANKFIDLLAVREKLALLAARVTTVTDAHNQLIQSKAERYANLRREAVKYVEKEAEKLDAIGHGLAEDLKHQLMMLEVATERRKQKAQAAYHASKAALVARIQRIKDQRIGETQGKIMRDRYSRQQMLDEAVEKQRVFRQLIVDDRGTRRELRQSILSSFRSFRLYVEGWFKGPSSRQSDVKIGQSAEETRALLLEKLEDLRVMAEAAKSSPMAKLFRVIPLSVVMVVISVVWLWFALRAGGGGVKSGLPALLIVESVMVVIWIVCLVLSLGLMRRAAVALAAARALEIAAEKQSSAALSALGEHIKEQQSDEVTQLSVVFRESDDVWRQMLVEGQQKLDRRYAGVPERIKAQYQRRHEVIKATHEDTIERERKMSADRIRGFEAVQNVVKSSIDAEISDKIDGLAGDWRASVIPCVEEIAELDAVSRIWFPPWTSENCSSWQAPTVAPNALRIGGIAVDPVALTGGWPQDPRYAHAALEKLSAPVAFEFPDQASVIFDSDGTDDGAAVRALHGIALRMFASYPPGRVSCVIIDPVGLGREFAGLMHLADFEESLIHHRIWTQTTHIEERLAELNDHIEKVIQMYLRDEFSNITEYNKQAGTIAEKTRFLMIAGFPSGFSDTAIKRLRSIVASGARCGVYVLIQRDRHQPLHDVVLDEELRRHCMMIQSSKNGLKLVDGLVGADVVVMDPMPSHHDSIELVQRIGRAGVDSNRVQVPFSQIAPSDDEVWSFDTSEELRVPVGRTGAKKLQMLAIGKGTRQHMLVAGKTGSGKSTLFHVITTNLALWCSPTQVEFYLVDFKKGVEFKCYAAKRLPHARVVAIESDREFALSVLQRVDGELKRRGELFRRAGAQDLAGYKRATAAPMPRTMLLIDEFQEFFTEDDAVAQEASLLLDRIVRQGRAFGIHVILGSQTLGGAYTLPRATLGQMVIRVALQCNESDAHLIMDDDNPAPRLLTRPGEGIYNDQAGALAANSPFQIVWLPEDERDSILDRVSARAEAFTALPPPPIVFEGNAPADVRDNHEIEHLLESRPLTRPVKARAWLGAPNSIKGPTDAVFQRQSGSHLLVVGQSAERALALLVISMASLAAQYPPGQVEFVVLDSHAAEDGGGEPFRALAAQLPHRVRIGGPAELAGLMDSLAADLAARVPVSGRDAPEVFVMVRDLQRFKNLRPEDDFRFSLDDDAAASMNPSKVFADLLGEGGPYGMHVIAATDTWNNVSRWIPRKLMSEFEMRVLFQMSANDSANLIDTPAATTLGLHRALFFNEHHGTLETFRPYAMPGDDWLDQVARKMSEAKTG